ncbi:MAG: Uncharacterised protein [Methanobacteriota archaeon]|jgi:hypothetical protein|nr:MAG: Uncharacterised protein [Euryarchaeota archaeon]|tara:strand:- start:984 stop:1472 length:489 start_codon:yes stop_codon:yes gene_type:complete
MDVQVVLGELLESLPDEVFTKWVAKRVSLTWLEPEDDRLGMTRFEEGTGELTRRRRLRLDPGEITIGLNPILLEEPLLLRHTLAHELLHAAGMIEHNQLHHDWVEKIAPGPSISESPLLQSKREEYLAEAKIQNWSCKKCGFEWERSTMRKPKRCFRCATLL